MRKFLLISTLLLSTAVGVQAKKEYVPTVYGNIIAANWIYSDYDPSMGVYSFEVAPVAQFTKHATGYNFWASGNGLMTKGEYNFVSAWEWDGEQVYQVYTYDTETWEIKQRPYDVNITWVANDFTQDPTTGTIYGLCATSDLQSTELCTIDFAAKKRSLVARIDDITPLTLACSNEGQLYIIGADENLYKVDKEFGDLTNVGKLGLAKLNRAWMFHEIELGRMQSATFDPKTNTLYWAAQLWNTTNANLASELLKVDVQNPENVEIVSVFPENEQLVALYIPEPAAADDAPAGADDVLALFDKGSLTGKVVFTAPTETFAGDALSGSLTYEVKIADKVVATGSTTAGARTEAEVTVETEGTTRFEVIVANEAGKGAPATTRTYVGFDQTLAPENVFLTINDGVATISWKAPTKSVNDGYFSADDLVYVVTRYASAGQPTEVARTEAGQLSVNYTLPASRYLKYYFGVKAVNKSQISAEATSDAMAWGPAKDVPYTEEFKSASSFNEWTSLDINGDKHVEIYEDFGISFHYGLWDYSTTGGRAVYYAGDDPDIAADDWLISPRLNLQKGQDYKLTFDAYRGSSRYEDEQLSVGVGQTFDVAGYETVLKAFCPDTLIGGTDAVNYVTTFQVPEDGIYNTGFHVTSPAFQGLIYVDNISLTPITPAEAQEILGIKGVSEQTAQGRATRQVYSLSGAAISRGATLRKGIYVIDGRKKVVK